MAKQTEERCEVTCPVYELIQAMSGKGKASSKMVEHLNNARVELLLAIRSVIDRRIEELKGETKPGGRSRRIPVKEAE